MNLSTSLSHALVAFTIEFDNEFERRFAEAGGGARVVSLVMWSNFLRFVGDGIAVGELPTATGIPKNRTLSTLGGMERWRYVVVGPQSTKRDGYGSARALRSDWVVRPTPAGRKAAEIWPALFVEIEGRWEQRFGSDAVDGLRGALEAVADRELPEYLPIVDSRNGMIAELSPGAGQMPAADHLSALLSQVLLAYTLDFERESELSLPLAANFVRVLDETGVPVSELPGVAGVSKEATAMALTFLGKNAYVVVEDKKLVRLTSKGRGAQERTDALHAEVEEHYDFDLLHASLERLLAQRDQLSRGLEPHTGGWRASKPYAEHTEAVVADPTGRLPHYPMVLHRGGWPDGS